MSSNEVQVLKFEIKRFKNATDWELTHQYLDKEHFLGAGSEAGDRSGQFILQDGKGVAVLIWCASALHLKKRDELMDWVP